MLVRGTGVDPRSTENIRLVAGLFAFYGSSYMGQPDVGDVHVNAPVMPIGPYADFKTCVAAQIEAGKSEAAAKRICGAMERDVKKAEMLIIEKAEELRFSLGVVYEPMRVDTQGDHAKADDIRKAAWQFMERLQTMSKAGVIVFKAALNAGPSGISIDITDVADLIEKGVGLDDEHLQVGDSEDLGTIVESYVAPVDFEVGGEKVHKGTWLLGVRWSEAMWDKVKKGERTGLSLFGTATSVEKAA